MSKFGLEIRNQLKLVVSRNRWDTLIRKWDRGYNSYRPSEGDLIYIPQVKGLFVIKYVDLESPFHQLNNLPVYKMTVELFEYRGEDMETGIEDVDHIQDIKSTDSSYRTVIEYSTTSSARFQIHESVSLVWPSSGITGSARVTGFLPQIDDSLAIQLSSLRFTDGEVHQLTEDVTITGDKSNAIATITKVLTLTDDDDEALNDGDISIQNTPLEKKSNEILDFSETNPFGDPNDA